MLITVAYTWVSSVCKTSSAVQLSGMNQPMKADHSIEYFIRYHLFLLPAFLFIVRFQRTPLCFFGKSSQLKQHSNGKRDQAVCWMLQGCIKKLHTLHWSVVPPHFSLHQHEHAQIHWKHFFFSCDRQVPTADFTASNMGVGCRGEGGV